MSFDVLSFQQNLSKNNFSIATILGCNPGISFVQNWGYVANIIQLSDIWPTGDSYIFPVAGGQQLEIVSNDPNDNSTITINGIDNIGKSASVQINLNGTTPVLVPGELWLSVQRAYTDDIVGVVGTIHIRGTGDPNSNIFAIILPEDQQTTQCSFLVPADKVGVITQIGSSLNASGGADDDVILKIIVAAPQKTFRTKFRFGLQKHGNSVVTTQDEPLLVEPLSKIRVIALPSASLDVSFHYVIYLIDKYLVPPFY